MAALCKCRPGRARAGSLHLDRRARLSPRLDDARQLPSPQGEIPHSTCHPDAEGILPWQRSNSLGFFPDEAAADTAADALKDSGMTTATRSGSWSSTPTESSRRTRSAHEAPARAPRSAVSSSCSGRRSSGWASSAAQSLEPSITRTSASPTRQSTHAVDLNEGKAAVAVMAHVDTAPAISDKLTQLGGSSESHELSDEALETAAADGPSLTDHATWAARRLLHAQAASRRRARGRPRCSSSRPRQQRGGEHAAAATGEGPGHSTD